MADQLTEKAIFLAVLALPEGEREEYLQTVCSNETVRNRIRDLVRIHLESDDQFLEAETRGTQRADDDPRQIDEFRIVRRLGEGGMGVVYLAEDTVLSRSVALKVLAPHLTGSADALARFVDEARSAAGLKHPGIVPVHKFGVDGRYHYIASEFVEGTTLADVIAKERQRRATGSMDSDSRAWRSSAARTVAMVADALEAAHRASIVHRDVKPSNILIDTEGNARLTDFGIAKQLDEETLKTVVIGSCHYMSPEQASIADTKIDQRSDIFSLGVVLYETIALCRPFDGPDVSRVLRAVATQDPARLRSVDSGVPKDLETICHKALEKQPELRYQTAGHMAADLRCFLEGRPILAKPPSTSRKVRHWLSIHRTPVAIASILLLVFTLAALIVIEQRNESKRWLEARCSMTIVTPKLASRVFAIRYDETSYVLGAPELLGNVSDSPYHLLPGHYRIEVVAPDGAFAEFDQFFEEPGESVSFDVQPVSLDSTQPEAMVLVATGDYEFGHESSNTFEQARLMTLPGFWLDTHEVSNSEYEEFLRATSYPSPEHWATQYSSAISDLPVVGISMDDMQAYARWAGKRLPTHFEWECAARWPDGRLYPWGSEIASPPTAITQEQRDDLERSDSTAAFQVYTTLAQPVVSEPQLKSALGLFHMLSNVSECTSTIVYDLNNAVMVKGAGFADSVTAWDLSHSVAMPRHTHSFRVGFRCARSVSPLSASFQEE